VTYFVPTLTLPDPKSSDMRHIRLMMASDRLTKL